jgi:chromosome segregation ATPase
LDVVACDEGVKAAVAYAVGLKTVVCDTLDDARRLAYSDNAPSVKAVSVSGAVIAQTGTMSGGHQQGGSSWRRADATRLERERSSKHDQLTQARLRAQSLKDAVAPHTARRDACASTAKWAAKDAQLAQSRVAECEARERTLDQSRVTAEKERDAKIPGRDTAVRTHDELRQAKRVVEERVYGSFARRHNLTVDDLCDDGDAVAGTPQALRKQRDDELKTHLQRAATLRAQLEYEK